MWLGFDASVVVRHRDGGGRGQTTRKTGSGRRQEVLAPVIFAGVGERVASCSIMRCKGFVDVGFT